MTGCKEKTVFTLYFFSYGINLIVEKSSENVTIFLN